MTVGAPIIGSALRSLDSFRERVISRCCTQIRMSETHTCYPDDGVGFLDWQVCRQRESGAGPRLLPRLRPDDRRIVGPSSTGCWRRVPERH